MNIHVPAIFKSVPCAKTFQLQKPKCIFKMSKGLGHFRAELQANRPIKIPVSIKRINKQTELILSGQGESKTFFFVNHRVRQTYIDSQIYGYFRNWWNLFWTNTNYHYHKSKLLLLCNDADYSVLNWITRLCTQT